MVNPSGKFVSTAERSINSLMKPTGWITISVISFLIGLLLAFLNFNISNVFGALGFASLIPPVIFWFPGLPQIKFTIAGILGIMALISLFLWNWVINGLM